MYQAIHYSRNERTYYLRDDVGGIDSFQYWPTLYKLDEDGENETLFGDKCSPFKGKFDWSDPTILEKDIDRELVLLRDLYYKKDNMPSFHNYLYLDIEIEIIGALNAYTIKEANSEITAIALIDLQSKNKICYILDKESKIQNIETENKIIISCKNEKQLIKLFLDKWEEIDPTVVVGYNSDFFDIPYLYYRIQKLLGSEVLRLSPVRKVEENLYHPEAPIKIGLVNCLDFMLLFKKFISKEESSYKLGDIGTKYAKLGKIEYNGSLNKLFEEDKEKFIDYNIRDVEIIEALEEKLKFINLAILISHLCHTPYSSIYYNTTLNEGAILTYLKRKGIVAPNKPTTINPQIRELNIGDVVGNQRGTPTIEGTIISMSSNKVTIKTLSNQIVERSLHTVKKKDSYAGGYLLDPVPGLYSFLCDLDYTSLYPSIIKSLNLGIETLMGRIVTKDNYEQYNSLEKLMEKDPNEIVSIQKLDLKTYKLKDGKIAIGELIKLVKENKWTISASGAFYRTDIKSIVCEVLEDWFDKREHYRALKKKSGKNKQWEEYKLNDLYQMAFKILQNALYGTFAINSWRFTDGHKICSAAITNSGQRLDKESIDYVNNELEKEIQDGYKSYIKAADTDSMYIELKDILKHRYPDIEDESEKISKLLEISQEIQNKANKNLDNISKDLFNIHGKHHFELKQEVIVKSAYWSGKRRYAMWIVNKEGITIPPEHDDALDMKGLDIMKSNFPKYFREFGEKLIKDILFDKPKEDIDKDILEFKQSLQTTNFTKIVKPTGLKKLDEYIDMPPQAGNIFSTLKLKCPMNTKAAIYSGDLIKFKKLDKKYPIPQIGDKIYTAYLKQNPFRIDVIALNGYNDPPEILEIIEKYLDIDEMFDSIIKDKIQKIYTDLGWGSVVFNPKINEFFKF